MSDAMQKVAAAKAGLVIAELRLLEAIKEAYPPGTAVEWQRGRNIHLGRVTYTSDYGTGERMRVRNASSGKEYWIDLSDIERAAITTSQRTD